MSNFQSVSDGSNLVKNLLMDPQVQVKTISNPVIAAQDNFEIAEEMLDWSDEQVDSMFNIIMQEYIARIPKNELDNYTRQKKLYLISQQRYMKDLSNAEKVLNDLRIPDPPVATIDNAAGSFL